MRSFGVSQARGRRSVPRTQAPLTVIISMRAGEYPTALIDVSRTGARLSGEMLPSIGEQVILKAEQIRVAAIVVWHEAGRCAVEFDTPIAVSEVKMLRWLGQLSTPNSWPVSSTFG